MKVIFVEVIFGFLKNSYKELGSKEMTIIPVKGDLIHRNGSNWEVVYRRFVLDSENGNYIKLYIRPYKIY